MPLVSINATTSVNPARVFRLVVTDHFWRCPVRPCGESFGRPLGGPAQVLEYLSRYTHCTAISNVRIRAITTEEVAFTVRANHRGAMRLERSARS